MQHSITESLPDGISVVVPVFNSATILPIFISKLKTELSKTNLPFELILVNDGSKDDSWSVILSLCTEAAWIRGVNMMRNYGQHNALLAGIREGKYSLTVTMDDDLQHPPEEIPKLLSKISEGYDVIYASPEKEQHGLIRDLASVVTKLALQSAMGAKTARMCSAWRIFRTELRSSFVSFDSPFVNIDVLLTWGTTNFDAIRVRHDKRFQGTSNYNISKLIRHAANMMTGFSVIPLQLASFIGFAFTFIGLLILSYVVIRYLLFGSSVAGFTFLASIIAIFSGAQLFALGIFGEYLARMHFRSMNKPTYVVRTVYQKDTK